MAASFSDLLSSITGRFAAMFNRKDFLILGAVYAKWYFLVMPIAIGMVYKIYVILEARGIPDRFFNYVQEILQNIDSTATNCGPLLVDGMQNFIRCL